MYLLNSFWFGLSDEFWGALFGSIISGLVAIGIYLLSKRQDKKNEDELLNNSKVILFFVHNNVAEKLEQYLDDAASNKDMTTEIHRHIEEIVTYKEYLNQIDLSLVYKDSKVLENTIKYISNFNQIVEIIRHKDYGFLFVKYSLNQETDQTKLDVVKDSFTKMKDAISKLG